MPALATARGLRSIVLATLSDPKEMIGEDSMAKGSAFVDVFLLAGEGEPVFSFK